MPPKAGRDEPPRYSFLQRIKFSLAAFFVSVLLRLIGATLRPTMSFDPDTIDPGLTEYHARIFPFWHRCALPAAYLFRNRNLAVMASRSTDGEYIARLIQKFGYLAIRGSSSRGGSQALLELRTLIGNNGTAVFTIDGPRGPRYFAKRGPILLASVTGAPIIPFYVAVKSAWVLNSWDRFVIPKPFSRIHTHFANKIFVPGNLDDAGIEKYRLQMQAGLEHATRLAEDRLGIATIPPGDSSKEAAAE
ncbi:MAG TPA: lysophospholipid acyltransferase family protein [Candidatus Koribacter sp.]